MSAYLVRSCEVALFIHFVGVGGSGRFSYMRPILPLFMKHERRFFESFMHIGEPLSMTGNMWKTKNTFIFPTIVKSQFRETLSSSFSFCSNRFVALQTSQMISIVTF